METNFQTKIKRRSNYRDSVKNKKLKKMIVMGSSGFCSSSSSSLIDRYEPPLPIKDFKTELSEDDNVDDKELAEDVLFEILLRLPLDSIFKSRCVSKVWFSVLSNPYFMNRVFSSFNTNLPWALFYRRTKSSSVECSSIDLHTQFLSVHDGFSFKFLPFKEKQLFVLDSSNGLVLCSTTLTDQKKYYVCNPLTKKWVSLPPPKRSTQRCFLNGLVCESSPISTTSYKVIRIPQLVDESIEKLDLEIFSSDLGEWKTYEVSNHGKVVAIYSCNLVAHNGVLYCIESRLNRIIAIDYNNNDFKNVGECRLIDLPADRGDDDIFCKRCLQVSQGFICYAQIQRRKKTLSVYVLDEDYYKGGENVWNLARNVELNNVLAEIDGHLQSLEFMFDILMPLGIHPIDRSVVILACGSVVLAYNMETGKSEVLRSPPSQDIFRPMYDGFTVLPFVATPRPTTIPPPSWEHT